MLEDKDKIELKPGFLQEEEFNLKYDTTWKQVNSELILLDLSEEDRELYSDVDILTGFDKRHRTNKFIQAGKSGGRNTGKKYNTVGIRMANSLKRFIDGKITDGEDTAMWQAMWDESKKDVGFFKELLNRTMGKVEDKINIKSEESITFSLEPDKNALARQKKNLDKDTE